MPSCRLRPLPSAVALLLLVGLAGRARPAPPAGDVERRVDELLARMTAEEKVGQLQQLDSVPNAWTIRDEHRELAARGLVGSFLNIRGAKAINEAQRLALEKSRLKIPILFGFDVIHGYRVIFPIPLAEAGTWDPAAVERAAAIAAAEAASTGLKWTFAPMVDIARDPRWGRIMEGSGEDPYLGSVMAAARVRGFQGDDPAAPDRVLACAKHWVAYGAAEGGRDYNTAELSEHTLRTVYLPPFRAALDAGAQTFMCSFNTVNGVPASANPFLLTKVLRDEWRFDGLLVSDYESVKETIAHRTAADGADAARQALNAGVDMEMVSRLFAAHLPKLLEQGKVPPAKLDEAVRRVLRVKLRAGIFEHPYVDESREAKVVGAREHRAAAREIAARSMVLLKNDGNVLPIKPGTRTIAVLGPLADDADAPLSHWRGDGRVEDTVTLLAGIRSKVQGRAGVQVTHAKGCDIEGDSIDGFPEAVRLARQADLAIVAVGEASAMSGEAGSRSSLDLPGHQLNLVKTIQATGTPTVVVLYNGRPLTLGWVADHVPALLEAWLPGTEGGNAVADVLFGDVNPGAKLPVTFPRVVGQVPIYYNALSTGRPAQADNRYTSKYIDLPPTPQFPFGHGLGYTRFELSRLTLGAKSILPDEKLAVTVDVKNVGDRAGDEVVQLYLRDEVSGVARPVKELAGFRRVSLAPGATQTVRFELGPDRLGLYDAHLRFVVEPGKFQVTAGTSSVGGLTEQFEVAAPRPE
ncbi:Periplasmic beta-glucosidase precursor (plasmid) [Aquisphaera giovannonii]|uniref:beta-glucosidase n=1 Tax=Aquisphaera giovannonii TaxID=406548 RepID=A0A5B9WF25_9BACT|nr:glycoside hydrolase family 3 N-terminal domain-containing protein [Aquisphaera giovannonii]QEH39238.1 Periplasmic beta-glucosidase precursor [Aquisphaera giovannonii]